MSKGLASKCDIGHSPDARIEYLEQAAGKRLLRPGFIAERVCGRGQEQPFHVRTAEAGSKTLAHRKPAFVDDLRVW